MDKYKSIVIYAMHEYGTVKVKLAQLLDEKGMPRNRLRTFNGAKYEVIDRYFKSSNVTMVDLDFIAKVCFVLNCSVADILEYQLTAPAES